VEARALGWLIEAVDPVILLLGLTRFYKIHIVTSVWRVHVIRPVKAKQTEC